MGYSERSSIVRLLCSGASLFGALRRTWCPGFAQLVYLPLLFEHDAGERSDEGVNLKVRLGFADHVAPCGEKCFACVRVPGG